MKRFIASFAILFALFISSNAHALIATTIVEYDNTKYEISYMFGPVGGSLLIELSSTPWWGDIDKAAEFAKLVDGQLGEPDGFNGPWFAWQEFNMDQLSAVQCSTFDPCVIFESDAVFRASGTAAYAKASVVPIPAAAWLFMSGLIGLVWKGRKVRQSIA